MVQKIMITVYVAIACSSAHAMENKDVTLLRASLAPDVTSTLSTVKNCMQFLIDAKVGTPARPRASFETSEGFLKYRELIESAGVLKYFIKQGLVANAQEKKVIDILLPAIDQYCITYISQEKQFSLESIVNALQVELQIQPLGTNNSDLGAMANYLAGSNLVLQEDDTKKD